MKNKIVYSNRKCVVCDAVAWSPFLVSKNNSIITGDQRIIQGHLNKVICSNCGVVANAVEFTNEELNQLYSNDYSMNAMQGEEHYYYTQNGVTSRSMLYAEWLQPYLKDKYQTLLEIGSGQGNLLKAIKIKNPTLKISGIEGNKNAVALAHNKKLPVDFGLVLDQNTTLPNADIIIAITVLEHIENIPDFLAQLKNHLNEDGILMLCLPIQNYSSYDIFFAEHVWHFCTNHVKNLLEKNNLNVISVEDKHPEIHGIGLFVCQNKSNSKSISNISWEGNFAASNKEKMLKIFSKIDDWLDNHDNDTIAVFGGGELFSLFMTFTKLGKRKISYCLDDVKSKYCKTKHEIPIYDLKWFEKHPVDSIILTLNPKYHKQVIQKLASFNTNTKVFSWI